MEPAHRLRLDMLHLILLELAVQRSFSDAQHARGSQLVAAGFAKRPEYGAALQFLDREQFIAVGNALAGGIVQVRWKIPDVHDGTRAHSHGALDGILQFPNVAWPVV